MIGSLVSIVCSLAVWPFLCLWRAYVIATLWLWFVTPKFSVAAPSLYLVTGLLLLLHLILPWQKADPEKESLDRFVEGVSYGLAVPLVALGCGWYWKWLQWGVS